MRRARKSIAQFKLREGMPVGLAVTLRGDRQYEFLDRLFSVAMPRIRDFRGVNPRSFDGRGNYTLGVREQIIFPEIDYDEVDQTRGLDVTITTNRRDRRRVVRAARGARHAVRQGRPPGLAAPQTTQQNKEAQWPRLHSGSASSGPPSSRPGATRRCRRCGRSRSVYRKFGVCRICLRELAHNGYIPGMTKSSW